MLQAALMVDHQQTVINAVEHGLKPLLARSQLVDISCLMLAQGFRHDSKAARQQVHFRG